MPSIVLDNLAGKLGAKLNCKIKVDTIESQVGIIINNLHVHKRSYELHFIKNGKRYIHKVKSVAEGKKFMTALFDLANNQFILPGEFALEGMG